MKLNFNQELKNFKGDVISENGANVKLADVCIRSLLHTPERTTLSGDQQYQRHCLAKNIYNSAEENSYLEITEEDKTLLKNSVSTLYRTLVTGSVYDLLENISEETPVRVIAEPEPPIKIHKP